MLQRLIKIFLALQLSCAVLGATPSIAQAPNSYKLLYGCDLINDSVMVADLKRIDDQLNALLVKTAQLRAGYQRFVRACRSLNGNLKQEGSKMDLFRMRSYEMGILKGRLTDLTDALNAPDAVQHFIAAEKKINRDQDAICRDEIRYMKVELLRAGDAALSEAQLDCGPLR